jgi:YegS/Rv2252/BmrU family lipid kinase
MRARALLIVNAKSRTGDTSRPAIAELLGRHGIDPVEVNCTRREDLAACIRDHVGRVDLAVVGGGDGTMNAAAPGLIESALPLGLLPTGTANDLARTLGIPDDLEGAAAVIAAGYTRMIDVGLVNGMPFFNVASFGLSTELTQNLTRDLKRRLGRLGYLVTALTVLRHARHFHAVIACNGNSARVRTLQIAVGNGRYYGGGTVVEETAAIDDGELDLYSLEFERAWKIALLALPLRMGKHGDLQEVRNMRASVFEVTTRRPQSISADGEILTQTPARFEVKPGAVTVFAPKPSDV